MKIDESLSKAFNVEPMKSTIDVQTTTVSVTPITPIIDDDYELTRSHIKTLLVQGQEALTSALSVAKQSEHPRAFEVVGNLMKQLADVNQQLMDLHQQKQKLDGPKENKNNVTNNNAIFVGSTAELNKMIKNMTKGE